MGSYSTHRIILHSYSTHVALLGTQLVEYGPTHHTLIWFSLNYWEIRDAIYFLQIPSCAKLLL